MKNFNFILALLFSSLSYGQAFDIEGVNRDGQVYYKDGHTETGKLTFRQTAMAIKPEDGSSKRVDLNSIEKFEVFRKKDTVGYAYIISERNYKKKKRYLNLIVYDGEKVKVYNEPGTAARVGAFSISQPIYFIQKINDPYAIRIVKPFKNPNKMLSAFFENCPQLSEKIGEEFKYKNFDTLKVMLDYYEDQCPN